MLSEIVSVQETSFSVPCAKCSTVTQVLRLNLLRLNLLRLNLLRLNLFRCRTKRHWTVRGEDIPKVKPQSEGSVMYMVLFKTAPSSSLGCGEQT